MQARQMENSPSTEGALGGQHDRLRAETLAAARRFKNSWVELGAVLVRVRERSAFLEWGFESFEAYCAKELHIRQKTAMKLTASYGFLMRHEPTLLGAPRSMEAMEGDGDGARMDEAPTLTSRQRFPTFEAISVLAGAEERGQLAQEDYAALRERLWGEEASSPKLTREITERFAEPRPPRPIDFTLRKFAMTARKLADGLRQSDRVPEETLERADLLAHELDAIARSLAEEAEEAEALDVEAAAG